MHGSSASPSSDADVGGESVHTHFVRENSCPPTARRRIHVGLYVKRKSRRNHLWRVVLALYLIAKTWGKSYTLSFNIKGY